MPHADSSKPGEAASSPSETPTSTKEQENPELNSTSANDGLISSKNATNGTSAPITPGDPASTPSPLPSTQQILEQREKSDFIVPLAPKSAPEIKASNISSQDLCIQLDERRAELFRACLKANCSCKVSNPSVSKPKNPDPQRLRELIPDLIPILDNYSSWSQRPEGAAFSGIPAFCAYFEYVERRKRMEEFADIWLSGFRDAFVEKGEAIRAWFFDNEDYLKAFFDETKSLPVRVVVFVDENVCSLTALAGFWFVLSLLRRGMGYLRKLMCECWRRLGFWLFIVSFQIPSIIGV